MARGLNTEPTEPLMIILRNKGDMASREKPELEFHRMNNDMMKHVDAPVDYETRIKKHYLEGPLLWEMHRCQEDEYFVDILAC